MRFEQRTSESPHIDVIWQASVHQCVEFIAPALGCVELLVTRHKDYAHLSIWGASASANKFTCPSGATVLGIRLRQGIFAPSIKSQNLINQHVTLPNRNHKKFELNGLGWQFPEPDEAEIFVEKLINRGILSYNAVVDDVLAGISADLSIRSVQRHFKGTIGISQRTLYQIQRAHEAAQLLQNGKSVLDTLYTLNYYDQSHLTRSLKRFIGYIPSQLTT